jgi:hypothetical protein
MSQAPVAVSDGYVCVRARLLDVHMACTCGGVSRVLHVL